MSATPSAIGLIPARSGSTRVKGKNVRPLAGHPLMAYTIGAALESGIFSAVVVSTDAEEIARVARHYGAEAPFLRPAQLAGALSPDIDWVEHALDVLVAAGRAYDCFSILRPTSPFRQAATIRRAWEQFLSYPYLDSLRAVERCGQHPGKMWILRGRYMMPLIPLGPPEQPWHSSQFQSLPEVYVQNASLEIAWCRVVRNGRTIAGEVVAPFLTQGHEGFDINDGFDWRVAEEMVRTGEVCLPAVLREPFGAA